MKQKTKLIIILVVEFVAIAAILLMIFFAGKKSYTVKFELNGGTLISGDLEQRVTQGQNATAPTVTKDGCYFLKWSTSYTRVTRDLTVVAIWEYETSYGIEYSYKDEGGDSNYCTISGAFKGLTGDIYIGAYHDEKKVLGIEPGAFEGCDGITSIYLLDGIVTIGANAFAGCTSLEKIELPSTLVKLGENAFAGCTSLQEISLEGDLRNIGENAFNGCEKLQTVTFGEELKQVGNYAFNGCKSLESLEFCAGLESVGVGAFKGCEELQSVVFSEGLIAINSGAFEGCTALQEVVLPLELIVIGSGAFTTPNLKVYACVEEMNKPIGWDASAFAEGTVFEWGYQPPVEEETNKEDTNGEDEE